MNDMLWKLARERWENSTAKESIKGKVRSEVGFTKESEINKEAFLTGLLATLRGRAAKREGKSFTETAVPSSVIGATIGAAHGLLLGAALQKLGVPINRKTIIGLSGALGIEGAVTGLSGAGLGYSITTGPTVPPDFRRDKESILKKVLSGESSNINI